MRIQAERPVVQRSFTGRRVQKGTAVELNAGDSQGQLCGWNLPGGCGVGNGKQKCLDSLSLRFR